MVLPKLRLVCTLFLLACPTVAAGAQTPSKRWSLPSDVVDLIVGQFRDDTTCLKRCSLVSHQFSRSSQRFLFSKIRVQSSSDCARFIHLLETSPHIRTHVLRLEVLITFLKESEKADWMSVNGALLADVLRRMKGQVAVFFLNFAAVALPFAAWPEELRSAVLEMLRSERLADVYIGYVAGFPLEWLAECGQLKRVVTDGQEPVAPQKPKGKLIDLHLFVLGDATRPFSLAINSPRSLLDLSELRVLYLSGSVDTASARRLSRAAGPALEHFAYLWALNTHRMGGPHARRHLDPFVTQVLTGDPDGAGVGRAPLDLNCNTNLKRLELSTAGGLRVQDHVAWLIPALQGVEKPLELEEFILRLDLFACLFSTRPLVETLTDFYLWESLDAVLSRSDMFPKLRYVLVDLTGGPMGQFRGGGEVNIVDAIKRKMPMLDATRFLDFQVKESMSSGSGVVVL